MTSLPPTICQAVRNSATLRNPTTAWAERWRRSEIHVEPSPTGAGAATLMSGALMSGYGSRLRLLPGIRCQHFPLQQIPDALAVGREGGIVADLERPRPLQRHRDVRNDPARRGAHHDGAVGQVDRLV